MTRIRAIIIAAQEEEVRPILDELAIRATKPMKFASPIGCTWITAHTQGNIMVMTTGIGQTATASALAWALTKFRPKIVLSTGSAGGLAADVPVGTVVVGTEYAYGDADATAFGYVRGQIPGQPARFAGANDLLDSVNGNVRPGLMLSSDSFVTAKNIGDIRSAFPDALTTDMESAAAAQVCHAWGVPFLSVRCISDLCGVDAQDQYSLELDKAACRAADTVVTLLMKVADQGASGPRQRFSEEALTAALLFLFAKVKNLPVGDPSRVSDALAMEVHKHLAENVQDHSDRVIGLIDSAQRAIAADSNLTMTAKQYDELRNSLAEEFHVGTGRGQLLWPPTSQTIIKRFNGYWNDALSHVGLRVQSGRKRGGLKFSERDYLEALRDFAIWSAKNGRVPSYKAYQVWVKEFGDGRAPSGAAIRQRFGSWRAATQAAQI
ncbi:MAG: 5'-methylthioadenosine/S-adenosylhomocysteine nucleosidase [Ancrocorticia sp.]|nr:5'-methylthioadenosine/S-adenosylhomocysteine nucleosidase [Ancrocorticia sp.]